MIIVVETKSEFGNERKFYLRPGEKARVGRTEWADWALPNDRQMADVHFLVECETTGCILRDLSEGATLLNREPVSESRLNTGDLIVAGSTTFVVGIEGQVAEPSRGEPAAARAMAEGETRMTNTTVVDAPCSTISSWAELDAEEQALVRERDSLADAVAALVGAAAASENDVESDKNGPAVPRQGANHKPLVAAVRLLAFALASPHSVRWACDCVEQLHGESLAAADGAALAAARQWIADPCDEHRCSAMTAAEESGIRSAAAWTAVAAAWSEGPSLEPSEIEEGRPDESPFNADHHQLSAKAVAGAVTLAGVEGRTGDASERYRRMIEVGMAIAETR